MKKIATVTLGVATALAMTAGPAVAKGHAPADGQCVASGVQGLDGPTIAAVANGTVDLGLSLNEVIADHAFNDAALTGAVTGADC